MSRFFDIGPLRKPLRVGLFGGSFNPPHAGHLHLSLEALKRFSLDRVIWLVSPGNPLKADAPMPLQRRISACAALATHPAISISGAEAQMQTRYTADTLTRISAAFPGVRFVWLMGADNLVQLHEWHDWKEIMETMPIGVLARPAHRLAALNSVAARSFRAARLRLQDSHRLAEGRAPRWCYANMPLRPESSTSIRAARRADAFDNT